MSPVLVCPDAGLKARPKRRPSKTFYLPFRSIWRQSMTPSRVPTSGKSKLRHSRAEDSRRQPSSGREGVGKGWVQDRSAGQAYCHVRRQPHPHHSSQQPSQRIYNGRYCARCWTFCRKIPQVTLRWQALYQAAQAISPLARGRTAVRGAGGRGGPYTRNLGQAVKRK